MDRLSMYRKMSWAFVAVVAGLTGGCAELASIHRSDRLPAEDGYVVSVDAKQRMVLSNPSKTTIKRSRKTQQNTQPGTVAASSEESEEQVLLRFCAEPPPDVFTALAMSLGAEASVSKSPSLDSAIAAKLAASLSENAATIERTQTINILREVMYRNCERYLSGGISAEEFIVQAARDQQLIVQVLAVEQITGVARAQSTALLTLSKAATDGVTDIGIESLAQAKKELDVKRAASSKASVDADALAPAGACGQAAIDLDKLPEGVTADQAKAKNAKCMEVRTTVKLVNEAEVYYETMREAVARQGAVSSETRGKLATAAQTASEASADIAEKVLEIVKQYQSFDEIGMTCVVAARTGRMLPPYCESLLAQMADTRQAQLALIAAGIDPEKVQAFKAEMEDTSRHHAQTVWDVLAKPLTADKLKALAEKAGVSVADAHLKSLVGARDFDAFVLAFKRLPMDKQRALAQASK